MDSVKVKVYAKINLSLNVGFKDGLYHDLDTVMTSVDLYDVVSVVKRTDKNINVSLNGKKSCILQCHESRLAVAKQV